MADNASRAAIFEHIGRNLISEYTTPSPLQSRDTQFSLPLPAQVSKPVGILGAGVGGLYTALILQSLNVDYEIIEASDRTGGRLLTHKFADGGPYDYFVSFNNSFFFIGQSPNLFFLRLQDVGAMRYPLPPVDRDGNYQPGVMQRLGRLFNYIGLQDHLVPYYLRSDKDPGFLYYNGIRVRIGTPSDFNALALGINQSYIHAGVSAIVEDVINPFAEALYADLENHTTTGWDKMRSADAHSVRSYMAFAYTPSLSLGIPEQSLATKTINWLETFDGSTGGYDRGLTEMVLDAIVYRQIGNSVIDWKCIEYIYNSS